MELVELEIFSEASLFHWNALRRDVVGQGKINREWRKHESRKGRSIGVVGYLDRVPETGEGRFFRPLHLRLVVLEKSHVLGKLDSQKDEPKGYEYGRYILSRHDTTIGLEPQGVKYKHVS